jgi:hypothetical protein
MNPDRRYSDDEVARIIERATEAQESERSSLPSPKGMTLAELQEIGREVGISADQIARAAAAVDRGVDQSPSARFLGARIGVGRTVYLDRRLTDSEWHRLVVDLRETFDAKGTVREEGAFRQWTNGNLQALLEPTDSGERLRLRTVKGDARASMGIGATMLAMVPVMLVVSAITGGLGQPGALEVPFLLTALGGFFYGSGRLRLPRWAATRELQMEGIAARLAASIETAPAPEDDDPRGALPS